MTSPIVTSAPATQRWDPDRYARNARFVAELGQPVVELLAPRPAERILDLGCGDGALTRKLAELGVDVVGVDSSAEQAAAACALGLDARVMSGDALAFDGAFDAVFSNAALHWMLRPAEVIAGVWRALKPGGRFVGEMGGHGNVGHIVSALVAALDRRGLDGRSALLNEVAAALRPTLCDAEGRWTADYVRLRFAAVKPA
jgi:trans-aconitate methyltransferase